MQLSFIRDLYPLEYFPTMVLPNSAITSRKKQKQPGKDWLLCHASHICAFPFDVKLEKYAYRIQKAWRNAITNPRYAMCRKRLLCEFEALPCVHTT